MRGVRQGPRPRGAALLGLRRANPARAAAEASQGGVGMILHWVLPRVSGAPLVVAGCDQCGCESKPVADERLLTWWELLHECDDKLERLRRACCG